MRTLSRAPGLAPGDVLNQALIRVFPPKMLPYTQAAVLRLVEGVMALQAKNDPTTVSTRKEGVQVPDLQETVKLTPTLQVALEVRNAVFSLTFSAVPSDAALERASSGRVTKVETAPAVPEAVPLTAEVSMGVVSTLLDQLKKHGRVKEIPESLEESLRTKLLAFCQSTSPKEISSMEEMLWARLQPTDDKWVVTVSTKVGDVGVELTLTKMERFNTKQLPTDEGKPKQVKEDVSWVRAVFSKWKETAPTEGDGQ